MRLALATLGALTLLLTFVPVAQADHDECRISLADPTSPNWTEECEEIVEVQELLEEGKSLSVHAAASVEEASDTLEDETGADASPLCENAPSVCKAGVHAETTIMMPPHIGDGDGNAVLLDTAIVLDHPSHGEQLQVTVPP